MSEQDKTSVKGAKCIKVDKYIYNTNLVLGQTLNSIVYRGMNTHSKKIVGIKAIKKSNIESPSQLEYILNEITNHKKLSHPNIVEFIDSFQTDTKIYIVSEYCNLNSLRMLMRNNKFDEREIINFIKQISLALKFCHDNNIAHRDIKPENILCHLENDKIRYKICDMGISKEFTEDRNVFSSSIGTKLYLDPQRLNSEAYTSKSDIYCLGLVAFEMIYDSHLIKERIENNCVLGIHRILENQKSMDVAELLIKMLQNNEEDRISFSEILILLESTI